MNEEKGLKRVLNDIVTFYFGNFEKECKMMTKPNIFDNEKKNECGEEE